MLDARIRSDHAIEKCMATIESLNNHVEHQNRQTESLRLELRQSLKSHSDLQSQLSALEYITSSQISSVTLEMIRC